MTYTIRPVRPTDLAAVTEVEAICFPAAEAAAEESFKARIAAFPECFFCCGSGRKDHRLHQWLRHRFQNDL